MLRDSVSGFRFSGFGIRFSVFELRVLCFEIRISGYGFDFLGFEVRGNLRRKHPHAEPPLRRMVLDPGTCERNSSQYKDNCLAEMRSGFEEGSYLRLIDWCITQI